MKSLKMTPTERVAVAICKMLSDLHLDIESLGAYIYRVFPPLIYNRFVEIAEAAAHEKKMMTDAEYAREFHKLGL